MTSDSGGQPRWWDRPFEMFQTNLREIDAGLDVDVILDAIQAHGADTWLINTGGILANYPTELPFTTPNPQLGKRPSGDLIGDAVRAAHDRGMQLMSRMDFSKVALPIADAHPDWCFRSRAGERQTIEGLASVCPSGGYYQRRTFDILDEILDRYPVDGFFFNWFGYNEVDYHGVRHGVCHCDACQRRYAEAEDGRTLPDGPESPDFARWRAFCRRVLDDLTGRIRDHIAARRPDAPLILGSRSDIVFHEANNKIGRELWPSATAEAVSAAKTVQPDKPVLVNSTVFVDMPYRMAAEDPHHVGQFFAQAIARGANPSTYIMGPIGTITYGGLDAAAKITRFHRDHRAIYDGLRPAATVALVRPDAMTQTGTAREEFLGWYAALQEGHVPFDVLPVERLAEAGHNGALARFRTVILPDLGPLAAEVITALEATDDAHPPDRHRLQRHRRRPRSTFPPAPGPASWPATPASPKPAPPTPPTATDSYRSTATSSTSPLTDKAEATWRVLPQAPFAPPEKAYGHKVGEGPAILANPARTGIRVAWTIGRTYREFGTSDIRRLMLDLVRSDSDGQPTTDSELPEQVEVIIGDNAGRTIVHLINLSGARRKGFAPPLPITGARLRLPLSAGTTAESLISGQHCMITKESDTLTVDLPTLDLFDVIVIDSAKEHSPAA